MLCNKCNKNKATVFFKQVVNGSVKEAALCPECAASMGILKQAAAPSSFDLISGLFGDSPRRVSTAKVCPGCGASYGEIASHGKVGCAKCYETFRGELTPTIVGIHGRVRHTGRAPKEYKAKLDAKKQLDELGAKLASAIEKQEFEEAAKLRDEIRRLRGE
nr:UvrB/UvrC motif-containing protein [Clostridia bacterium]